LKIEPVTFAVEADEYSSDGEAKLFFHLSRSLIHKHLKLVEIEPATFAVEADEYSSDGEAKQYLAECKRFDR